MTTPASSVLMSKWPDHFVPICTDGRANKAFPYVLDVAHLVDYCMLQYYPAPVVVTGEPVESSPFDRRSSSASPTTARRRSTAVGFGADSSTTASRSITDASPLAASADVIQHQPAVRFEFSTQPTGALLLMGATLQQPLSAATSTGVPSTELILPGASGGRTLADDEKYFTLRLPNQRVLLKPSTPAQTELLINHLTKWIRVANQQMFNSRVMIVRAEFSALPSGQGLPKSLDAFHQQQAAKDDLDFCRGLSTAIFGFGCFANARLATSDKGGVPDDTAQRTVALGASASSPPSGDDENVARKKSATLLVPFSFGTLDKLSVSLKHEQLGWYVPYHHKAAVSLMTLMSQHDCSKQPFVMELVPRNTIQHGDGSSPQRKKNAHRGANKTAPTVSINARVKVVCKFSWVADENWTLRVAVKASGLLRRDYYLSDPLCFISTSSNSAKASGSSDEPPPSTSSTAPPTYKYISEAYRNKIDAEFAPMHFALPLEIPKDAASANLVDFVTTAEGTSAAPAAAGKKRTVLQSKIFPSTVLPPVSAPLVTVADLQSDQSMLQTTVTTNHRFGDDVLWPYIQPSEVLTFEVVDANFDSRDTLPSLIGAVQIPVRDLLSLDSRRGGQKPVSEPAGLKSPLTRSVGAVATESGTSVSHPQDLPAPLRLPLSTNLPGSVSITSSTPASTIERLRQRQRRRFPIPLSRFVFTTAAEATAAENSQLLNRSVASSLRAPEVTVLSVAKHLRPSFLGFFQAGQWDISSLIVLDCTHSALWSHFNSFLPNDMPDSLRPAAKGGSSSADSTVDKSKGLNIYETIVVAVNRLLVPLLTRGGSDVLAVSSNADGGTSVHAVHQHPEGFGAHIDETSLTWRRLDAATAFAGAPPLGKGASSEKRVHGMSTPPPPPQPSLQTAPAAAFPGDRSPFLDDDAFFCGAEDSDAVNPTPAPVDSEQNEVQAAHSSATPPPSQPQRSKNLQVFSVIRDWGGEASLVQYKSKLDAFVLKARSGVSLPNPSADLERAVAEIQRTEDPQSPNRTVQASGLAPLPPPISSLTRQPIKLASVLRRCMQRAVALSHARKLTCQRVHEMQQSGAPGSASLIPPAPNVFHIVTIVIHSEVEDAADCLTLLLGWLHRPVFFILVFLDDAAPNVFCGVPNCITVDMTCCSKQQMLERKMGVAETSGGAPQEVPAAPNAYRKRNASRGRSQSDAVGASCCGAGYETPLLAVHKQLASLEAAVNRIPLAFLSFARLSGSQPPVITQTGMQRATTDDRKKSEVLDDDASALRPTASSSAHTQSSPHRSAPRGALPETTTADDHKKTDLIAEAELAAQAETFLSAKEKFLIAFGFKKKPQPPAKPPGEKRDGSGVLPSKPSLTTPSILQVGSATARADRMSLRPTFSGADDADAAYPTQASPRSADLVSPLDINHLEGQMVALPPAPPKDLRMASVSIVDVYMDEEQLREWEVDPQQLRPKMQQVGASRNSPSPSATSSAAPLIDDSLIRLHLQRINALPSSADAKNAVSPTHVDEDEEIDMVPTDAANPVQVFSRKTKYDGHLRQVNVRVGGMESFAAKLPVPPTSGSRRGSSARPSSAGIIARRSSEVASGSFATTVPSSVDDDPNEPQRPLTARQMASKREAEETQKAVDWALRKLLKKTTQHLKKPHIHSRLLQANQTITRRLSSATTGGQSDVNGSIAFDDGTEDDGSPQHHRSRSNSAAAGGGGGDPQALSEPNSMLSDTANPFHLYRSRQTMQQLTERNRRALDASWDRARGGARASSRLSSSSSTQYSGPSGRSPRDPLAPSSRSVGLPPRGDSRLRKGAGSIGDGADDDDANVRLQQLTTDKKQRLQHLLAADTRSFGGPRLNEEAVYEQEAEIERRHQKEKRMRETARIEEAYRAQKQQEINERNRLKIKQFILSSSNSARDDELHQTEDGEADSTMQS